MSIFKKIRDTLNRANAQPGGNSRDQEPVTNSDGVWRPTARSAQEKKKKSDEKAAAADNRRSERKSSPEQSRNTSDRKPRSDNRKPRSDSQNAAPQTDATTRPGPKEGEEDRPPRRRRRRRRSSGNGPREGQAPQDGEKNSNEQKPHEPSENKEQPERKDEQRQPRQNRDGDRRRSNDRSGSSGGSDRPRENRRPREDKPRDRDDKPRNVESSGSAPLLKEKVISSEPWDASAFKVEEEEGKTRFHDLGLPEPIMHAIHDLGFKYCTPIQAETLPLALLDKDIMGQAQTGTGKTAAFLIAMLSHFHKHPTDRERPNGTPRALILAPTRELVIQIEKDARGLSPYIASHTLAVYGGTDLKKQRDALTDHQVDVVVATPGRLLQFCRERTVNLRNVDHLVIDEADRMLDMGFIPDVRSIVRMIPAKEKRQTLLFSATLSDTVMNLSAEWLVEPEKVIVEPEQVTVDTVDQLVYLVKADHKYALLYNVIKKLKVDRALVFVNRRDATERVYDVLKALDIDCDILSGAVPQNKRTRILDDFRAGKLPIMIATDVAGRGIHIEGLDFVINFDIPYEAEEYVHRIGRTGRAGKKGTSITFACEEESFTLADIEEYIGRALPCSYPEADWFDMPDIDIKPRRRSPDSRNRGGQGGRPRSGGGRSSGGPRGGNRGGRSRPPSSS